LVETMARIDADPARTFTLRAPLAGTLERAAGGVVAPVVGARAAPGSVAFLLAPRAAPSERADAAARLATARGESDAAEAALPAARSALDRARKLNLQEKNVSDRAVEEALSRVRELESKGAAARALIAALEPYVARPDGTYASLPIACPMAGEWTGLFAVPGEQVEAGTPLATIVDYSSILATVAERPGDDFASDLESAEFHTWAGTRIAFPGTWFRMAPAASGDGTGPGRMLQFRCTPPSDRVRPGMIVGAQLPSSRPPREGWQVPRGAVVVQAGKMYIYISTKPGEFRKLEVDVAAAGEGTLFVAAPIPPGAGIVTAGAQSLLSEELKSTIPGEDEPLAKEREK
jgi:biotin carboxyl carrier protein